MMSFNVRIEGISRKRTRRRGRQSECRCNQRKKIKLDSLGYVTLLLIESSIFSQKHWMGVVNTCCLSQLSRVDRSSSHPCPQPVFPSAVVQWFFSAILHFERKGTCNYYGPPQQQSGYLHPPTCQQSQLEKTSGCCSVGPGEKDFSSQIPCRSDLQIRLTGMLWSWRICYDVLTLPTFWTWSLLLDFVAPLSPLGCKFILCPLKYRS